MGKPMVFTDTFVESPMKFMGIGLCAMLVMCLIGFAMGLFEIQESAKMSEFIVNYPES
jgi:hypothetical protein